MSDQPINNLQQAVKTAAGAGSFALDSAFLTSGLNDTGVKVPASYDADLTASFQLASAAAFLVTASPDNVGPVTNGGFKVTNATIPFLSSTGTPVQTAATLFFTVTTDATPTLVVQIATAPATWTWTDSFEFMGGWPFNQLIPSNTLFVFSTSDGFYPWANQASGLAVTGGANQNFQASIPLPSVVQPYLVLFTGLQAPPSALKLTGVLNLSAYNNDTVLLPTGTLTAVLQNGQFSVFYLNVANPSVMLQIPAPPEDPETDDSGQAPTLTVSALLSVGSTPPDQSPYILQIMVDQSPNTFGAAQYSIGINATGVGTPLTPDSIVTLLGGGGSYFSGTPAVLQQFMAFVALQGLSVSGTITPASISRVSVSIGSSPDTTWSPIPNPPQGLDFTITAFSLNWSITNPLNSTTRQQSFLFSTEFTLLPSIFKGPDGEGDGIFAVEFTSGLSFSAEFDGTVSLTDFLYTVTAGTVSLPSTIEATLSDIKLNLNYNAKSFSFSSGFDVALSFLTVGYEPILSISDGTVSVTAMTPPQSGSNAPAGTGTVWKGAIGGLLGVGPLQTQVSVAYNGTITPSIWNLSASLAQPITVQELIQQFFSAGGVYNFPNFLPGTLTISTFNIEATIPSGSSTTVQTTYSIAVGFLWTFSLGDQQITSLRSLIGLNYDGTSFSGSVLATWTYDAINLELIFKYTFQGASNQSLAVTWQGFTATYTSQDNQIAFSLKGWSLGSMIQALVRTLGDPYFTLPSPWDLLNQISLDGLSVNVSLQNGLAFSERLSASYTLSSPLELGFIRIDSLKFVRTASKDGVPGKVTLQIVGSSPISSQLGNLMQPGGQDVQNMPTVPGRGSEYFKVFLLVLGQRVGITGSTSFANTAAVIKALEGVPSTQGKTNPVNPDPTGQPDGQPYYNQSNNWLIAGHLGLLQVAGVWTVDAMVVFNDPNLYGLRLALAGTKAGGLAGLAIDILYKKITDDIGLFQINFTFPDSIRNINLGAVSIVLPQIGIQIYTNGDFLIDIGFPYNLDFRRSFSLYAIVYGVPVMGSGGFYFGKLSSATATQVPKTNAGTFDPVIVFGIGLQLGLGYDFTKGPLSAGFSLTVFGIIEGVIAAWHPYSSSTTRSITVLGDSLQSDYYFKISGTVGVIGLLYGKVDFAIISASVNVKIVLSIQITYESFRAIPLTATAYVSVSVSVKIDLGLFSFSISFSFSMTVSAQFVIGANETAPWDTPASLPRLRTSLLHAGPDAILMRASHIQPRLKKVVRSTGVAPTLRLLASPQFTVLAPEGSTAFNQQQGAFVFLTAIDAPTATTGKPTGGTSFDLLCAAFFPWVINALSQPVGDTVDLEEAASTDVTRDQLDAYVKKLADTANPPLDIAGLLGFLGSAFTLNIETPDYATSSGDKALFQAGASVFPVFDGLSLSIPDPSGGSGLKPIPFETYATANSAYRQTVAELFASVEATIEKQNQQQDARFKNAIDDAESMAALIFVDYFSMMGRQLLQAARNLLDSYAWPLQSTDTIANIVTKVNAANNDLQISDIALPNQDHALSAPLPITVPPLNYTLQAADTLTLIATRFSDTASSPRWSTTQAQLILANPLNRILQPGVAIPIGSGYTTVPGDSFQSVADALAITLQALAGQKPIYDLKGLLIPSLPFVVPAIAYTTAADDTLRSVAAQFGTTVPLLAAASSTVAGLFSVSAENGILTLANLNAWNIAQLWTAIQATDQVAQTAGMISRFLMFGLRLPQAAGLSFSGDFLFPTNQTGYALYQLTGQEFPTPAPQAVSSYPVQISVAQSSHGVNLSFVQFNNTSGTSATIDLTKAYGSLSTVLGWAQQGNFQPSPSFTPLPASLIQPKGFAASNFAYWVTSDIPSLEAVTNRGFASGTTNGQAQPTLWPLPSSLLALTAARQAAVIDLVQPNGGMKDVLPLLPQFQPQIGQTSPATQQTEYSNLSNWTWATRLDFKIMRLPVTGLTSGGAADTPQGTATVPTLPNVYEVSGATSAGGQTLELLLRSMDSLGEGIVSGLFLLYQQPGQTPALTSLGAQEFLAFLTQTNLSTETNPSGSLALARAFAGSSPRGVANTPGEFIKLLWELSTVRSGGYYLFYQQIDSGAGLPSDIFDANGESTLSMIVTFATQGAVSFGNTTPAFVNSFVSTDNLDTATDVVQLLSLPTSGTSAQLTGASDETLAMIAALYGAQPGAVAALNPSLTLTPNALIPIVGIRRQLAQADLTDPSQTLANLATYYSQGAQDTITATDIQNNNPGVPVTLGSVFYIPTVSYLVSTASAPGASFGSMAAYYGISLDAISIDAMNVPGLFPKDSTLQINTQVFDLRSMLGPGNVSFELTRTNYGAPPDNPADPAYPQKYMYSLYNTLSAGVAQNVFFKPPSAFGLPFGPQVDDDSPQNTFTSHARRSARRAALLLQLADADFIYSQSLGFGEFAQINAAPANPATGLPAQEANPYIGVGSTCQVALRWQDVFGNTTITPFTQPPAGYSGALNGAAAPILYSDRLVGVSSWVNTLSNYIYSGSAGSPLLNINFAFDTTPYVGNPDQAKRDLALYQTVYFQLNQDYTGLGVPGVTGNAVTMSLTNSLLATPNTTLTDAQAAIVRGYISSCVQYLSAAISASGDFLAVAPLPVQVQVPVSVADVAAGNIIALDVTLVLTRKPALTDPAVAALADGLSVSSGILPRPDVDQVPGQQPAFVGFATAMETTFQTTDWYIKVGEGLKQAGDAEDNNTSLQLWAARFGNATGKGIFFEIVQDAPSYYAPKPVATTLISRSAQIVDYQTGNTISLSFTGVDQNQWFQTVLTAIDTFLSASDSTSAFILDKLLGTDDPLKDGYLGKVLQAKQSLADSISSTVLPILSTSLADSSTQWAAKEKLRQQLLNQIGAAYAAGASVIYNVTNVSGAPPVNLAGPPNLYGQPAGTIPGSANQGNQNFTLTSGRIPLGPTTDQTGTYDPRLAFFFTTKNVDSQAYVPLNLTLSITHLEFNRSNVPGIDGYVESEWLVFVNGPFNYNLSTNTVADIPVVNRNLPTPPTVTQQLAGMPDTAPVLPIDLTRWDYSFDYTYHFAAQDTVETTIELNLPQTGTDTNALTGGLDLFTALAQFVTSYPAISADFKTFLVKIDAETTDETIVNGAAKAVSAFQQYLTDVATAFAGSLNSFASAVAAPQHIKIDFETVLTTDETTGAARSDLLNLTINGVAATWNQATNTISNGTVTLPTPIVWIDPAQYTPVAPPVIPAYPAYIYQLTVSKPATYLPYSDALANPQRTVSLPSLDVLLHQNCLSSIAVDRNKILFPVDGSGVSTNQSFVFTTPQVSFANPIVPRLVYEKFSLDLPGTTGKDLEALLNNFFAGLNLGGDATTTVEVAMTGSYSYEMHSGFPVSLPVCLLPPIEMAVDPSAVPAFTSVLASAVAAWIAQQHPTTSSNAQIGFRLTIFGSGDKQPLLVVDDLYELV